MCSTAHSPQIDDTAALSANAAGMPMEAPELTWLLPLLICSHRSFGALISRTLRAFGYGGNVVLSEALVCQVQSRGTMEYQGNGVPV